MTADVTGATWSINGGSPMPLPSDPMYDRKDNFIWWVLNVANPPQVDIADDADGSPRYTEVGTGWTTASGGSELFTLHRAAQSLGGSARYSSPHTDTATWTFTGLQVGAPIWLSRSWPDVYVGTGGEPAGLWRTVSGASTGQYTVTDGTTTWTFPVDFSDLTE